MAVAFALGPAFVLAPILSGQPPAAPWRGSVQADVSGHPGSSYAATAAAAALLGAAAGAAARASRRRSTLRAAGGSGLGRRGSVAAGIIGVAGLSRSKPAAAKTSKETVGQASEEVRQLIKSDPNKGPTLVRLAWHSSGTYDKMSKTGGSELGTIRFKEELAHGGNAGLDKAVAWMEPIKQSNPSLSYADLYTLGGAVAIEALGGPSIPWRAGRVDSMTPDDVTPDGRLPNAANGSFSKDADHIRMIFNRMGFNDQEIVALSGAHALGRCHADASGFVGPWTPTPTTFNNLYFTLLKNLHWEEGCIKGETCKNPQYKDPQGNLMMLPTDIALIKDESFKTYVDMYAADQKVFFSDFSKAFSTLLELGTNDLYAVA